MIKWYSIGLLCAVAAINICGAEQPESISEPSQATKAIAKAQELISAWENSQEQTTATAQALMENLVAIGPASIPGLIQTLETSVAKQSLATGAIMVALMRLKATQATSILAKLFLTTSDHVIKRNILIALREIGSIEAIPTLMKAFNTPLPDRNDPKISRDKLGVLSDLAEQTSLTLQKLSDTSDGAWLLTQELSKNFFTMPESLKLRYILILQKTQRRAATQFLLNLLSDPSAVVRAAAITGLGFNGDKSAALIILPQLRSTDIKIKAATAATLGKLKFIRAIPDLLPLLNDKNTDVVSGALYALRHITGKSFNANAEHWQIWYDNEKIASQTRATMLLKQIKSSPAEQTPALIERLADCLLQSDMLSTELQTLSQHQDFRVRAAACNVLAQIGDLPALYILTQRLLDPSPEVIAAAYSGLQYATGLQLPMNYEFWQQALKKRDEY